MKITEFLTWIVVELKDGEQIEHVAFGANVKEACSFWTERNVPVIAKTSVPLTFDGMPTQDILPF